MGRYQWAVGLEDQDTSDVDLSALEDPQNGVEANSIECAESDGHLDELQKDGEQLSEDTDSLEEISGAVEAAEEKGGMDESAARVVDVAVEAIATRWGIRRRKVGLENFNGANRSRGTQVALESIMDTLKEMWQRFVEWISEVINKLKDFWLKYFNAGKALQKRADKLEERLDKGLGERSKDKINGSWIKKIQINGKADIDECVKVSHAKTIHDGGIILANYAEELGKAIAEGKKIDAKMKDRIEAMKLGTKTTKSFKAMLPSDADLVNCYALPGGRYMVLYKRADMNISSNDPEQISAMLSLKIITVDEVTGDKTLPTPTAADMYKVVKAIRAQGEELEEVLKDFRKADDHLATARDKAKAAAQAVKDANEEKRPELREKLRIANNGLTNILQLRSICTSAPYDMATGMVGYVQSGIAAYKSVKS